MVLFRPATTYKRPILRRPAGLQKFLWPDFFKLKRKRMDVKKLEELFRLQKDAL